mgnify:CR=1 FL=1
MNDKKRAIEICNNLKHTIKHMKKSTNIDSQCTISVQTRAKKSALETLKSKLIKRYKLTTIDLI